MRAEVNKLRSANDQEAQSIDNILLDVSTPYIYRPAACGLFPPVHSTPLDPPNKHASLVRRPAPCAPMRLVC